MENKENKDIRISAYVPLEIALKISSNARNAGMSVSQYIGNIIEKYLEAYGGDKNENNVR